MSETPKVAVIGTGHVGGALGLRLAQAGVEVVFGARDPEGAGELVERAGGKARVTSPAEAAAASDVVIVAVPGAVAVGAVAGLGDLSGKIVVDCTNPVAWEGGPVWNPPPAGSNAAAIAEAAPRARVVKAFNTFGAEQHADPQLAGGLVVDVFVAGDDAAARRTVGELARRAGFQPVDAGPLRNAAVLENVAILWIHLATVGGLGREISLKLVHRG